MTEGIFIRPKDVPRFVAGTILNVRLPQHMRAEVNQRITWWSKLAKQGFLKVLSFVTDEQGGAIVEAECVLNADE